MSLSRFILSLSASAALVPTASALPPYPGDTQGYVSTVAIRGDSSGTTVRIVFSSVTNNRWNCMGSPGYVEVTTRNSSISPLALALIYHNAQQAKRENRQLALDSPTNNCLEANNGWLVP